MDRCERTQLEFSALLDGHVEAPALAEAMLHGVECADCRASFARFARLQRLLPAQPAPRGQRPMLPWPDLRGWAAAALVLLSLLAGWSSSRPGDVLAQDRAVAVSLGAHPERMNEARFVEVAVELLQADPRYARSMRELLDRVVLDSSEFTDEGGLSEASSIGSNLDTRAARATLYY
jgi:hypothetical protein